MPRRIAPRVMPPGYMAFRNPAFGSARTGMGRSRLRSAARSIIRRTVRPLNRFRRGGSTFAALNRRSIGRKPNGFRRRK